MKTRVTYYYPPPQHFNPILYPDTSNFLNDFHFMRKSIKIDGLDIVRLLFLTSSQDCWSFFATTVQSNFSLKYVIRLNLLVLCNQLTRSEQYLRPEISNLEDEISQLRTTWIKGFARRGNSKLEVRNSITKDCHWSWPDSVCHISRDWF